VAKLVKALNDNNIECRPLICGSIGEHPFWYERYGKPELPNAKKIHEYGVYIPNHPKMTKEELDKVIKIVNENV
jgi:CDP-6-deoxy-D-xylo-4-hexulose-3-dehydrase